MLAWSFASCGWCCDSCSCAAVYTYLSCVPFYSDHCVGVPVTRVANGAKKPPHLAPHGAGSKKDRATLRAGGAGYWPFRFLADGFSSGHVRCPDGMLLLCKLATAREKKARRKNIARRTRDEEEIRLFRGTVSCVCTCMELDTEKLLPALQCHLEKQKGPVAVGTRGHSMQTASSFDMAAYGSTPHPSQEAFAEKDASQQKPSRSYIEGAWSFKMYVDVLHVQSVLPTDDVVNAARAELLERRTSLPAQAGTGTRSRAGVSDARLELAAEDEPSVQFNKVAQTPEAAADVKQLLAHVAARATSSPKNTSREGKQGRQDHQDEVAPAGSHLYFPLRETESAQGGPGESRDECKGRGEDVEEAVQTAQERRLAQGYTVIKPSERKSIKSPGASPKLRSQRQDRRLAAPQALALDPTDEVLRPEGDGDASDDDQEELLGRRRRVSRAHRAAERSNALADPGLSDVDIEAGGGRAAFLDRAPIYLDGGEGSDMDAYEAEHVRHARFGEVLDAHFASADPLHDEFEAGAGKRGY